MAALCRLHDGLLRRLRQCRLPVLLAAALLVAMPPSGRAQDRAASAAEPYAPHDHWSRAALRRLAAAGVLDAGSALAAWPLLRSRVRRLFTAAAAAAERRADPAAAVLARGYQERFAEEFPPPNAGVPAKAAPEASPSPGAGDEPRRGAAGVPATDLVRRNLSGARSPSGAARTPQGWTTVPAAASPSTQETSWAPPPLRAAIRLETGLSAHENVLRGGASQWVEGVGWVYPGPVALPDASSGLVRAAVDLGAGPVAASVAASWAERLELGETYLAVATGGWEFWAGRRGLSFGAAGRRAIVVAEGTLFDGGGIAIPGGFRLPGPFRALGPVRGALVLARMERSGPTSHPTFWGARVSVSPHPSLAIGFNRAALFGGEGNGRRTPRTILLMLAGFTDTEGKDSDFENQVASVDVYWRTTARDLPLALYAEWGFDDMGFAWTNVPGLIGGVEIPLVPGAPSLGLGIEHVHFAASCCGNPPWYRHGALAEGWTDRGRPLGQPLGGHGHETSLRWRLDLADTGILAGGRVFRRQRGEENIFAPDRTGRSLGASLRFTARAARRLRLVARAEIERGQGGGWWMGSATLSTGIVF